MICNYLHPLNMPRVNRTLAGQLHLGMPQLCADIEAASQLGLRALARELAPVLGVSETTAKTDWLRWRNRDPSARTHPTVRRVVLVVSWARSCGWLEKPHPRTSALLAWVDAGRP